MEKRKYAKPAIKKIVFTDEAVLAAGCKVTPTATAKSTRNCVTSPCRSAVGT